MITLFVSLTLLGVGDPGGQERIDFFEESRRFERLRIRRDRTARDSKSRAPQISSFYLRSSRRFRRVTSGEQRIGGYVLSS